MTPVKEVALEAVKACATAIGMKVGEAFGDRLTKHFERRLVEKRTAKRGRK